MPREPQTTKRPPTLAPQHRAQRIGDLLEREEYEYRTWILLLFTIEYCWVGEPSPCYANITLKSKDMGYLKSHDMSMTFSETDASKIINQLMPSKTRTNNAAEEISEVPSSNQPSSTTASIRIPDIEIPSQSRPFPHNLIIPSPCTDSFAVDYRKCGFLKRTFSHVCDSIRKYTVETALQPCYENNLTIAVCLPSPSQTQERRAGKEEVAQSKTFQRSDGSSDDSNQGNDRDNGKGPDSGRGKQVRRGGSGQSSQNKVQVQGGSGQNGQNKDQVGTKDSGGWKDGVGEKQRSLDPLLKVFEKQGQKQYITKWQSQLPSWPSSYYPLPSTDDLNKDKEATFIDYINTIGRSTYYQVSLITRAVEMLKMEIIPILTARMNNLYSGQITSQHVLADPGWDAPISELFFSNPLRTFLSHTDLLPVLSQSSSHKPPLCTISGSENARILLAARPDQTCRLL
ncbi:hypothetical protein LQV05_002213 [Cryptococcus neoformans]|nr:hypothetical protein LQV05_002213 [Cryptococcus neoformans]